MGRATWLGIAGLIVFVGGLLLILRAEPLATTWQPRGDGTWAGSADSATTTRWRQVGLGVAPVGTTGVALAASRWLRVKPSDLPPVDAVSLVP